MKSVLRKLSKRKLKELAAIKSDADLSARVQRIKDSIARINVLMVELQEISEKCKKQEKRNLKDIKKAFQKSGISGEAIEITVHKNSITIKAA